MNPDILSRVIVLAAEEGGVDPAIVSAESHFKDDLNFDSLSVVEFAMKVEDEFEMSLPDDEIDKFQRVGDVVRWISENRSDGGALATIKNANQ